MSTESLNEPRTQRRDRPGNQPTARDLQLIGYRLGGCEITEFIGRGGMGSVFKAKHESLNREVAIKILNHSEQDDKAVQWFLREARSIACLEHPNIIQIYDLAFDQTLNTYFIIMQYVKGESLDTIVKNTPENRLDPMEALRVATQTAEGLAAAHRKGIIHRDVKPANLMLAADGQLKITDFGLAKGIGFGEGSLTEGIIVGTPLFMAPEQCVGTDIDGRADIYSLGASFYFLVTGRPPFVGESSFEILEKQIGEAPVPPLERVSTIPKPINDIILRMLAKAPRDRFNSCEELAAKLKEIVESLVIEICPRCARENSIHDTFTCIKCGTANLCISHLLPGSKLCNECASPTTAKTNIYRISGVDLAGLIQGLQDIAIHQRTGLLSLRSREARLMVFLRAGEIEVSPNTIAIAELANQYPQSSSQELISLLLLQCLAWEAINWEFSEEEPGTDFYANYLQTPVDTGAFLLGYSGIGQILLDLGQPGSVIIATAVDSIAISYHPGTVAVYSPAPSLGETGILLTEMGEIERRLVHVFSTATHWTCYPAEVFPSTDVSFTCDPLNMLFLETVYQYPEWSYYTYLCPDLPSVFQSLEVPSRPAGVAKDIDHLSLKVDALLRPLLNKYDLLEKIGLSKLISLLLTAAVLKQRLGFCIGQLESLTEQLEGQGQDRLADSAIKQILEWAPGHAKLLERLAGISEKNETLDRASRLWHMCGQIQQKTKNNSYSKTCFLRAVELSPVNPDPRLAIFSMEDHGLSDEEHKKLGLEIVEALRKQGRQEEMAQFAKNLLEKDANLIACHKTLINYYLDRNDTEKAVTQQEKLATIYEASGDLESLKRLYSKILKLSPDRLDIQRKLENPRAAVAPASRLQQKVDAATSVIKRQIANKFLLPIVLVLLGISLFGGMALREYLGKSQLAYFTHQVQEGKFDAISGELILFSQKFYLLGTSKQATALYIKAIQEQRQRKKAEQKQYVLHTLAIAQKSLSNKDFELAIRSCETALDTVKEAELREELQKKILEINLAKSDHRSHENEALYEKAQTYIQEKEYDLAKANLKKLIELDFPRFGSKASQDLLLIEKLLEKNAQETTRTRQIQEEKFRQAEQFEKAGELPLASKKYEECVALKPGSEIGQQARRNLENLKQIKQEGENQFQRAEELIKQKNYPQAIKILDDLLRHPLLSTLFLDRITYPLWVETQPVALKCLINGQERETPCLYRYRPDMSVEIKLNQPGFQAPAKERKEERTDAGVLWKVILGIERVPLWNIAVLGEVDNPLLIANGQVFLGTRDNYVYSLDLNGQKRWEFYTGRLSSIRAELVYKDDTLYVPTQAGTFWALHNAENATAENRVQWSFTEFRGQMSFRGGAYILPRKENTTFAYLGSDDGNLYLLYKQEKAGVSQVYKTGGPIVSSPIAAGNLLIVGSGDGHLYALSPNLQKLLWKTKEPTGAILSGPLVGNNAIYVGTTEGLAAYRLQDGQALWNYPIKQGVQGSLALGEGLVYAAGASKNIYAVDTRQGDLRWVFNNSQSFERGVGLYKNLVLASGGDFQVVVLASADGSVIWKQDLPEQSFSVPACDGERIILSAGKTVYAYWIRDLIK